jgi:4-carboxymuconolactone decarboxylase
MDCRVKPGNDGTTKNIRESKKMKRLLTFIYVAASLAIAPFVRADEITRFLPMKAERAYIYNPDLANRLSALSDYLRWNTSLPPRLSELAILITARQWAAQYEWYAHYPLALKGGLDPKTADAIAAGKPPEGMKDDEKALYDLAIELYRDKKVSDPVYKAALSQFGERGIMDIIGIIGYYDLVSMTLITMQAGMPDDKVKPLPALTR